MFRWGAKIYLSRATRRNFRLTLSASHTRKGKSRNQDSRRARAAQGTAPSNFNAADEATAST
jgi:hypothetical protein